MAQLPKGMWLPGGCLISLHSRLPICQLGMVMGPHFEGCGRRKRISAHLCLLWRDHLKVFSRAGAGGTEGADGKEGRREKRGAELESHGGERGDEQRGSKCAHRDQASLQPPPKLNRFLNGLIITTYEFF